ncbi:MAG: hypothetical protein JNL34_05610 [Anaerolineae bacterium]|nr:hypothetical protein [Anaerolineae bacterium]
MPLIVIFIFGAIIIGAGVMFSPAWPTREPRIGLNSALALALITGGAVFWASLFGWSTLVVDYLLFALVCGIFLFGTLSYGQKRAERTGATLKDADQGWPGPADVLLFAFAGLIFIIPALVMPVPLDTDAQGFGYLALMARLGDNFRTLAPFHPEITYLYSPGFIGLVSHLSKQLGQGVQTVQMGISAILCLILVMLAYDFGSEVKNQRLGRAMALASLGGLGLFLAFMDSHYTTLLALVFAFAFLLFAYRYLKEGLLADAIGAGLMLGAVVISHPDTTIILALGYIPWLFTMWFGRPRPTTHRWLVLAIGIPLIAVAAILPWLWSIRDLLGADITSPFERDSSYWRVMLTFHGILIPLISVVGAAVGLRQRRQEAILAVGWLIVALDFAAIGLIEAVFGGLLGPIERYDYPFSVAWHGPIIPYTILGGIGLLWLWDRFADRKLGKPLARYAPALLTAGIIILAGTYFLAPRLVEASKGRLSFYGAFSSADDVTAMEWLRANTPPDARILNYSAPHEADWAPVISERDAVYYRPQPFFTGDEASLAEQERLRAFWQNPADPANRALLDEAGVDFVLVPQIAGNPDSIETMWRWRPPFLEESVSRVTDVPWLRLIFDSNGAQVYEVVREGG